MFNTSLFTARNIAVIAAITIVTHIIAKPLFKAIDNKA